MPNLSYNDGEFRFFSLGKEIRVTYPGLAVSPSLTAWYLLTLLHYLDLTDGTPLTGMQMNFSDYREGMVRGGGFDRDAESIIQNKLGLMEESVLIQRCLSSGAHIVDSNADLCMRFDFVPQYPIWLRMWFADEVFPASGRMLVDEAAHHYLTVEDAVTAGSLVFDLLTSSDDLQG